VTHYLEVDRGVFTAESLFRFLHVLGVIVWVGGVLTVNVLQVVIGRGQDRAGQAALLRLSDLYGRAVLGPAAAVTVIAGLLTAAQLHISLGTFWVAWGIAGVIVSIALGATLIRVTIAKLRQLVADGAFDDPRWPALRRRLATLYSINLLVLVSVVWAMEFKPAL
jgi:uncharacterized membrane protein